jgi:integrase
MDSKRWIANTKNDFATAVQRAFNWAVKQGLIDRNPVAHVEKPAREARELAISSKDYAEVMQAVSEPNFRALLELAWETGAREQELRKIEAKHFDAENRRIILPPKQTKGRKYHRVIYLPDRAVEVVTRLCRQHPRGTILRNSEGKPWTKDAINCAFCRLKKKIGRKLHLGAWRKGYATEALKAGLDTVTVAHLLGHRDGAMVSRIYGRVQQDPAYMAEAARRAKSG